MKILLILATATTILTTAARRPAPTVAPDLIRDAVRHAVGFDRLAPLLARAR